MRIQDILLKGRELLPAGLKRDFPVVCGVYEDGENCSVAIVNSDSRQAIIRRFPKKDAPEEFAKLLRINGIRQENVAGAVVLPEFTMLDFYEEQLGVLGDRELQGAAAWSLMTRETVMERQVWWAAVPAGPETPGIYRIGAIPQEEGEEATAFLRSLGVVPAAVFVTGQGRVSDYRITVPELTGEKADEGAGIEPAEQAAYALWTDFGRGLPGKHSSGQRELLDIAAMNFLPLNERPELFCWTKVVALLLIVLLLCLGGVFFKGQQEVAGARSALINEETVLKQQDTGGEGRRRMIAAEKSIAVLESEAVRLSAERRPASPTLEALGVLTPAGVYLTELTGEMDGTVLIKGRALSREQIDRFIAEYRQRMNPRAMKLKSISEVKPPVGGGGYGREFVISLGEEMKP